MVSSKEQAARDYGEQFGVVEATRDKASKMKKIHNLVLQKELDEQGLQEQFDDM